MGADLILGVLEIEKDREPDWEATSRFVLNMSDDVALGALALVCDLSVDKVIADMPPVMSHGNNMPGVQARLMILSAVDSCRQGWAGHLRMMCRVSGVRTDMLIAGGVSWGDSITEVDDLRLFDQSGAASAAGFLSV